MMSFLKNLLPWGTPRVNVKERFDVKGKSGMGSMSQVFRAFDKKLGRTVCLKLLDKEKTAKFEARFPGLKKPSEGVISMELSHPHIVKTYEHGLTTNDEPYLVMEYIDAPGLHGLIEAGGARLAGRRVRILVEMAEAIGYVHKKKFLHRDICPRNILIHPEEGVKFIDFGLAVPYTPEFCKPGNRTGTASYLAPEIIRRTTTDHRVDLFALGVTAYEIFTLDLPWGRTESLQTLLSHMNAPGRNPRELVPKLDDATVAFLLKAVERDPRQRFQNTTEFAEAAKRLSASW
jgi:serine/threonine protein kinase